MKFSKLALLMQIGLGSFVVASGPLAQAASFHRPENIEEVRQFQDPEAVENDFIPGGVVVWAKYDLLRRDFDFLKKSTNAEIDAWIVKTGSYMSVVQRQLVNYRVKPYKYKKSNFKTYRDALDGRADLEEITDPSTGKVVGLMSRKGGGISQAKLERNWEILRQYEGEDKATALSRLINLRNTNGVMMLDETIREVLILELLQKVFDVQHALTGSNEETVENYYMLKLPMKVFRVDVTESDVTILGRQANVGRIWSDHLPLRKLINRKQIDYSGSTVDGGTVKLDATLLPDLAVDIADYRSNKDIPSVIEELKTNPNAIHDFIKKATASLDKILAEHAAREHTQLSLAQANDRIAKVLLEDPINRASLAGVLVAAQERGSHKILQQASSQAVIKALLQVDPDVIDESYPHVFTLRNAVNDFPLIRWGLVLLPSLQDRALAAQIANSVLDRHPRYGVYIADELKKLPESSNKAFIARLLKGRVMNRVCRDLMH